MRKLILETQLSIDGFIADAHGNTDWMIWNWGADWKWNKSLQQYHTQLTQSADCILLSKQMAVEGFKEHWQKAAADEDDSRYEFANHIARTHTIVFSKTLNKSTPIPGGWNNTTIAAGDYVAYINALKQQEGKNILVYGGAAFVASLIKEKLVDEFHFIINPVALGNGMSIFKELTTHQKLALKNYMAFDDGIVVLHYQKK